MIKLKTAKEKFTIFLFILPAYLIYFCFQIVPLIGGVYFSFADWSGIGGDKISFVGFSNYIKAFQNPLFGLAFSNMLRMVVISVICHTPIALLLAVAINTKLRGYRVYKALFFMPTVFPMVAIGLMWYFIFMPTGALNSFLKILGMASFAKPWLVNKATAMNVLIFVNVWAGIGYYMVIILAGLTTIPKELYEAAAIDGADKNAQFFNITVPMLKPTLMLCIVMDVIGTVKIFDLVFSMTGGGPNGLTNLPTTLMYNEAFKNSHYGVGSAIGIIILIVCLGGTLLSNGLLRKRKED